MMIIMTIATIKAMVSFIKTFQGSLLLIQIKIFPTAGGKQGARKKNAAIFYPDLKKYDDPFI
jgi:hypothetical protein